MTLFKKSLAISIASTLLICASAHANGLYKWQDADGNTHYGDTPPADKIYETIGKSGIKRKQAKAQPSVDRNKAKRVFLEGKEKVEKEEAEAKAKADKADAIKKDCENILSTLGKIKQSTRIRKEMENGEIAILGGDERQKEIDALQEQYDKRCK